MKKRTNEKKRSYKSGILTSSAFGAFSSMAILLALLMLFSLIGQLSESPHSLLTPFSFFSIYTSSFFGGFISVKKNKGRDPLLCGLICGILIAILFSLIFLIFGLIFDVKSTPISWLFRAFTLLASIIGALISSASKRKAPKRKRRRR